jgi:hypothetical protein
MIMNAKHVCSILIYDCNEVWMHMKALRAVERTKFARGGGTFVLLVGPGGRLANVREEVEDCE